MNKEILETQWSQIRDILHDKFSNLTDEDIRQINGRYDQLVAKLQQKYGYSREEAEERIRNWNFDRFADNRTRYTNEDKTVYSDDSNSIFKWILLLGLPILLLGLYFWSTPMTTDVNRTPTVNQERVVAETPADHAISTGILNALQSRGDLALDISNVHVTTNSGVVTLSGTVPNAGVRDLIGTTAQNFTGVRRVVNNIQVTQ